MARYRFISCHPVSGALLHSNLNLIDAKWNWVVGGNGQLTAKITVPEEFGPREVIRAATNKWQSAIYVKTQDNAYPWGGPVVQRKWNRRSGQLEITCMEWRAWPYGVIMGPNTDTDQFYAYSNVEQLSIARSLFQTATSSGAAGGNPTITYDSTQTSGKNRDLHFYGSQMNRLGPVVDTMANRDGGFEWTLAPRPDTSTGLPKLHLYNYFPERGSVVAGLHFKSTPKGSNCEPGDIVEDASQEYNKFWATGAGQPPDQLFSYDTDPVLSSGLLLRLDGSASYSTVVERPTLTSHARRARRFYASGVQTVPVTHNFVQINPDSYGVGDRGRLQLRDRFVDIDENTVRVVSKEIDTSGAGEVRLVLDLTDFTLPEVDTGGSI